MANNYMLKICEVCGDPKGSIYDHTECSEILKEANKDIKYHKAPKKMSSKASEYIANYIRRIEGRDL